LLSKADQPSPIRPARRAPAGVSPPTMIAAAAPAREGRGVSQRVVRRFARDGAAGPQRADHGDRLLEARDALGRRREVDSVGRVLARRAADPHPSINRPPLAIWSVDAILARTAGWRFTTLATNGPTVIRRVAAAAMARIVQLSTTGTVLSPWPMKWSHDQTPA